MTVDVRPSRPTHTCSYDRTAIAGAPDLGLGEDHPAVTHVQRYLRHYGYLSAPVADGQLDPNTSQALVGFQRRFELSETGTLDEPTRSIMFASRCGLADILSSLGLGTMGGWERRDLTYAFGRLTSSVPASVSRAAVRRAFGTWASAGAGLSFTEVSADPDILIEWRPAADPDYTMVGNVVAHADYPPGFSIVVKSPPQRTGRRRYHSKRWCSRKRSRGCGCRVDWNGGCGWCGGVGNCGCNRGRCWSRCGRYRCRPPRPRQRGRNRRNHDRRFVDGRHRASPVNC